MSIPLITEATIRNMTMQVENGQFHHLLGLKESVMKYIEDFVVDDKRIYNYTHVSFVFSSYSLIYKFFPTDSQKLLKFILRITDHVISEFQNLDEDSTDAINNFQAHRLKVVSTAALVTKRRVYIQWSEMELRSFIGKNIDANDGMCLDFLLRDSLTYVVYTLGPILQTCLNLHKLGRGNYYHFKSITGSSIHNAVRWLVPYINGAKQNTMFIRSIYASDKHKKEYGKIWDRKDALQLINMCINFDRGLIGLYRN